MRQGHEIALFASGDASPLAPRRAEEFDQHGRTVILKGDRTARLRKGEPVKARDMLPLVRHAEAVTNGAPVPEWYDIL